MYRTRYKNSARIAPRANSLGHVECDGFTSTGIRSQQDKEVRLPKLKLSSKDEDLQANSRRNSFLNKSDSCEFVVGDGSGQSSREIRASEVDLNFGEYHKDRNVDKGLGAVNLSDSGNPADPHISIQGGVSSSRGSSFPLHHQLHSQTLSKRKSVDRRLPVVSSADIRKGAASQLEQRVGEYFEGECNDNRTSSGYTSILRRTSSLSSVPSYFYPDPYSIVLRTLGDGSAFSGYSSTAGSEATEYLQLSRTGSPLSSPEKAHVLRSGKLRKDKSEKLISSSARSKCSGAFDDKMNFDSALSTSEEYQSFRSSVPLRKICVEADGSKEWKVYDAGPKTVRTPLLCLGPACATADVFYRQILNLTARGIRVIAVEGPVYWSVEDWCKGLKKLLDCLNLDKVHILGASLGGFLGQKFAEYTYHYSRVASLILCNTFLDTSIFDYHDSAMIFWMLPSVILKKLIIENITSARIMDLDIAHAIEFMIERLNNLSQQELASRMTLNCVNNHVDTFKLKQIKISVMDVFDESALSSQARDDIYRNYSHAKLAHLKSGGNFPYLSRTDDVNMHIMVHLRAFNGTKHSAQLEEISDPIVLEKNSNSGSPLQRKLNGSSPEDVFGMTETDTAPAPHAASSFDDEKNLAFKEEAAAALGLPVQ